MPIYVICDVCDHEVLLNCPGTFKREDDEKNTYLAIPNDWMMLVYNGIPGVLCEGCVKALNGLRKKGLPHAPEPPGDEPAIKDAVMQRPSGRRFNGGMPDPEKE